LLEQTKTSEILKVFEPVFSKSKLEKPIATDLKFSKILKLSKILAAAKILKSSFEQLS
jgi:hypothetical protein